MKKSFYNTVGLTNPKLAQQIKKAATQQDAVYCIFKAYPKRSFSARELEKIMKILLTSVHRCLSNLTDEGLIAKTDKKIDGIYGVVNGTWKLNK